MKNSLPAANRSTVRPHLNSPCRKTGTAARAGRALPRLPLMAAAVPEKHPLAAAACAVAPVPAPMHTPPEATAPGLPPATLAAAVRNGVVLRSAADRTALFAHWLAPHLPMVHGIVRRHSYFASECADNYQSVVLHLLEHLDALAHFALRCARRPHGVATPAASAVADTEHCDTPPPSCTPQADALPELPPLADAAEDDVAATLPPFVPDTEARTPSAPSCTPQADSLPELPPLADAAEDDVDATQPPFVPDTEVSTDPAPEIAATLQPVIVTADAVMHTARAVDPRPWLAGVTLRLLSTLNGRALRHRATHLTPASSASDEPFDPADPDGGLAPTAGTDPAAGAQSDTAHAPQAAPHGTADSAPADCATPSRAHRTSASAQVPTEGTAARESPRSATPCPDDCLERWHREVPRPGFHRTGGGRLWKAMRERAQQAHSAFAYRTVLDAATAAALAALPLRDRALVLLTADGWTAEEIGQAIGTSPTAVRQTVCRVRLRLRQWRRDERKAHARRA